MMRIKVSSFAVAGLSFLVVAQLVSASGMEPCTKFTTKDGRFNIGDAYAASDLVAIGQVVPKTSLKLHIIKKLKGDEKRAEVSLTVPHCAGTACGGGFSVAAGVDLLFLLRHLPDGEYDGVGGNGNYSCPVVFEVKGGLVEIGGKKVSLKSVKHYLETKPDPI